MAYPRISAKFETTLALKVNIGDTTGTLTSVTDADGTALPNGTYSFTVDEGNSDFEYFEATITGTTLSNVVSFTSTALTQTAGFTKQHRAGAEIKITDFTILGRLSAILRGAAQLDAAAPLEYDDTATISGANQLATKAYVDSVVNGGSVTYDAQIILGVAGEAVSSGDWVYLKESDGRWYKTDANTASTCVGVKIGMAKGAGTVGAAISGGVFVSGLEKTGTYSAGQAYYISNTTGELSTTAGENEAFVGVADDNGDLLFLNVYDPESVTQDEKDALGGTVGTPSENNKYVTDNNATVYGTDQSQSTQDTTSSVGESDATTKRVKIAQKFIPTKSKIRGVNLYKSADTGEFSGTVTVSIQADNGSGDPDGSALATVTLTNPKWNGFSTGEVEVLFASEYTSLDTTSTDGYHIVIETSTTDDSNHPNLGVNSAGGYASGGLKYQNTTDGWTTVSGQDLYFKTLEGAGSQVVKTNSDGKIDAEFFSPTEMLTPMFEQEIYTGAASYYISDGFATNSDSSIFITYRSTGAGAGVARYEIDEITGSYIQTHITATVSDGNVALRDESSGCILGNYVYLPARNNTASPDEWGVIRYDLADLANPVAMTIPTITIADGNETHNSLWTDGKYLYMQVYSSTTVYKFKIDDTTLTTVTTGTMNGDVDALALNGHTNQFDGEKFYRTSITGTQIVVYSSTDPFWNTYTTVGTYKHSIPSFISLSDQTGVFLKLDDNRFYVGIIFEIFDDGTTVAWGIKMRPFSL